MKAADADRWAEALADAAGKDAEEAASTLEEMARAFTDSGAIERIPRAAEAESRLLASLGATGMLAGEAPQGGVGERMAARLLVLLARSGQLSSIADVAAATRRVVDARSGTVRALVETALPLAEDQAKALEEVVRRRTGARRVSIQERLLPELWGGARITVGGIRLDGTLRRRLETLGAQLGGSSNG